MKMEQFKVCEKDTKTKVFPKDGISRESRADPKEAEREDKRVWLSECVEKLENIVETITGNMEKATASKGKSKNKEQVALESILYNYYLYVTRLPSCALYSWNCLKID